MACSTPSVTIWGTTQVTSNVKYMTTIVHEIPGSPAQRQIVTSEVEGTTVITSIIPQRTIFGSCSPEPSMPPVPSSSTSHPVPPKPTGSPSSSEAPESSASQVSTQPPSSSESTFVAPSRSSKIIDRITTFTEPSRTPVPTSSKSSTSTFHSQSAVVLPTHSQASGTPRPLVIGAAVGGSLIGLILLVLFCVWCRRRGGRDDQDEDSDDYWIGKTNQKEEYWERRFQALEANAEGDKEDDEQAGEGVAEVKKIRLTLDLHSKKLSTRASRLSSLSAFLLPMVTPKAGAAPFRRGRGSRLNFSRPLASPPNVNPGDPGLISPALVQSILGSQRDDGRHPSPTSSRAAAVDESLVMRSGRQMSFRSLYPPARFGTRESVSPQVSELKTPTPLHYPHGAPVTGLQASLTGPTRTAGSNSYDHKREFDQPSTSLQRSPSLSSTSLSSTSSNSTDAQYVTLNRLERSAVTPRLSIYSPTQ